MELKKFISRHKHAVSISFVIAIILIVGIVLGVLLTKRSQERAFKIDYENDQFLMDGKTFRFVSGTFHYFRAMPQTWKQKLKTMKAGGLNAIDLYVHWALHNPEDGIYNFDGIANVKEFVELASDEGFYIIFRPGPYICAEIDNGGLPYWLASKYPNITLRSSDPNYLFEIEKWYSKLLPLFKDHWYGDGGKIIMVQVENELGAYKTCDVKYLEFLRDETLKYVSDSVVLFTSDWSQDKTLSCGIEGLFKTINFGLSSFEEVEGSFNKLREYQPKGPLVVTEFWDGWFSLWQGDHAKTNVTGLANTLDYVLAKGASVNLYVYYGGTNFGFWAGADTRDGNYMPDITSYDYDAPMNEAGNPTEKFYAFKNVIKNYLKVSNEEPIIYNSMTLERVTLKPITSILSKDGRSILGSRPIQSNLLLTFEELGQFSGLVLYETKLPKFTRDPAYLELLDLRDRALIYVDDEFMGTLSRENNINKIPLSGSYEGSTLSILVENQGRLNFGVTDDYKGIRGGVRIQSFHDTDETYEILSNWTITGYPFEKSVKFESLTKISENSIEVEGPMIYHAEFEITGEIFDTYWDYSDWGKGFIFVNEFNLGRYWSIGPQMTIYIPKETLNRGKNNIYVVEYQEASSSLIMKFSTVPIFL